MPRNNTGSNPFERLRRHFDDIGTECPECGHENEQDGWESTTDGSEIQYRYVCSNCGAERERSIAMSE